MIVPVMAISNLVLTQQIYSEETNGEHAHNRDRVPLRYSFEYKQVLENGGREFRGKKIRLLNRIIITFQLIKIVYSIAGYSTRKRFLDSDTGIYYSTIMSFYHIRSRAKYEILPDNFFFVVE